MTWNRFNLGNTPNLREVSPIGHPKTLSKTNLSDCITSLRIHLGLRGVLCTCLGNLIFGCDLHAMILVTYEPLEGLLVVPAGPCPVDRYIEG
jgi:hypothetical protein